MYNIVAKLANIICIRYIIPHRSPIAAIPGNFPLMRMVCYPCKSGQGHFRKFQDMNNAQRTGQACMPALSKQRLDNGKGHREAPNDYHPVPMPYTYVYALCLCPMQALCLCPMQALCLCPMPMPYAYGAIGIGIAHRA